MDSKATKVIQSSSFHLDEVDYTGFENDLSDDRGNRHHNPHDISYTMMH